MKNIFTDIKYIGPVKHRGKTEYNSKNQTYTLSGSGKTLLFKDDEFHFASKEIIGDFIMTCSVEFIGQGTDPHRKAGLMIRSSLKGKSVYADVASHGDGLTSLQYRLSNGADTLEIESVIKAPHIIQLERSGKIITMRTAAKGLALKESGSIEIDLSDKIYAGLFVGSYNSDVIESAIFRNFRLDVPAPSGTDGNITPPKSRMEIINTETWEREVLFSTDENIEAPNWSLDGEYLLYNKKGLIYRYDFDTKEISHIKTGIATRNNNDHGISPDGKTLIISSHGEDGASRVYTVPINGGEAKLITESGPSYWHGVSPDGKTLAYCAEREGDYNVWCIPTEGGNEYRLTKGDYLDDGPEYSKDGEYIYFNSTRTGKMKIWRMKTDGSGMEQFSGDDTNDWFAHFSPNGEKMVYISYPPELQANLHPHNQHVTIKQVDMKKNEVENIAYIYGGQGTLNVPSWSPDGKYIAFVSYTYGNPEE